MRVIMVSKYRRFQGGVERHIRDLSDALLDAGHSVQLFSSETVIEDGGYAFDRQGISTPSQKVRSAAQLMWNQSARNSLREHVSDFRPDLIHFHSIYHQLSPSVMSDFDIPSIMTLHDFKLAAPCYSLYRDGELCTDCVDRRVKTPAISHRCVGGSRAASVTCVAEDLVHRPRYLRHIDRFIVPSAYSFDIMTRAGYPREKLTVVPWGSSGSDSDHVAGERERIILYAGRLHPTKGISQLLEGWARVNDRSGWTLHIAGDGELRGLVERAAAQDSALIYHGMLDSVALSGLVDRASVGISPSVFPETMGLSVLEFLRSGLPVISSGRGALSDLSGPGVLDLGGVQPERIRAAIDEVCLRGAANRLADELKVRDLSRYSVGAMLERMLDVYAEVSSEFVN